MAEEMGSRVLDPYNMHVFRNGVPYPIAEDVPSITENFHQWVVKSGTFQTILVNTSDLILLRSPPP